MRYGQILEIGPVAQIFARPQHPYTQQLLRAVPTMTTDRACPLATL
jgi:oligopeptide/dipeptide ABC transporter ATP-binding protein